MNIISESIKIDIDNEELQLIVQGLKKVVFEHVALAKSKEEVGIKIDTAMDILEELDPVGYGKFSNSIDSFFDNTSKAVKKEEDKADFLSVVDEVKADGSKTYKYVPYSELPHGMLIDKLANGFNIRVANVEVIKKLNIEFFTISKLSQVEASTHDGDIISRPTLIEMGIYTDTQVGEPIEGGEKFPF